LLSSVAASATPHSSSAIRKGALIFAVAIGSAPARQLAGLALGDDEARGAVTVREGAALQSPLCLAFERAGV